MTEGRDETLKTYQDHAQELAKWFAEIGSRDDYIDRAFEIANTSGDAYVVELGCGDGRDSGDIVKRTPHYVGVDYSSRLLDIARQKYPEHAGMFVQSDMLAYEFDRPVDIVFAFASFLHLSRDQLGQMSRNISNALRPGGVVAMTLKRSDEYREKIQDDKFGRRVFYLYPTNDVVDIFGEQYEEVYRRDFDHHGKAWSELMMRKI